MPMRVEPQPRMVSGLLGHKKCLRCQLANNFLYSVLCTKHLFANWYIFAIRGTTLLHENQLQTIFYGLTSRAEPEYMNIHTPINVLATALLMEAEHRCTEHYVKELP